MTLVIQIRLFKAVTMKNICFLNSIKFWGGGEKLNLEYATEFQRKKYKVILLSHQNSPLWDKASENDIKTFPVTIKNLSFLNPITIVKLIKVFKRENVDTVILSNSQDLKAGSIAAKLAGVKNIVYYRSIAVPIKNSLINILIFKSILTHIVANSNETKSLMLKNLGKYISTNSIKTIYYGVDLSKFNKSLSKIKTIQEKGHGVILGNAGRLTAQKGQRFLIDIAKNLKEKNIDFTLFIAGTGELQDELETSIRQNNLQKHVILLGFVEDMEMFMNSIDIFLLTSMWEGFGYVIVEAMLKSKPVIAFNMTSNPEVVSADVTGFLVDYPDSKMFTEKTELLITNNILREEMGKAGFKKALDRFVLEDRVTELEFYIEGKTMPY